MNCIELTFRIIELVIAASIPALIAYFGFKLSGKIEDIKNESASKYLWRTKWTDVLFQKHLEYCDNIVEFINCKRRIADLKEYNQPDPKKIEQNIDKLNETIAKLYKSSTDLRLHSENVLGQNNKIGQLLSDIWNQIHHILKDGHSSEQYNLDIIYSKLFELNRVTGELVENKKSTIKH